MTYDPLSQYQKRTPRTDRRQDGNPSPQDYAVVMAASVMLAIAIVLIPTAVVSSAAVLIGLAVAVGLAIGTTAIVLSMAAAGRPSRWIQRRRYMSG